MKKELLSIIERYKERELQLITLFQTKDGLSDQYREELESLRDERKQWLETLGGGYDGLKPADVAKLKKLVLTAEQNLNFATIMHYQVVEYIRRAQKSPNLSMGDYDRHVEDYSQLEVLADDKAKSSVGSVVKFNNKRKRRSYLSDIACKFKKSKLQEQSEEKTEEKSSN